MKRILIITGLFIFIFGCGTSRSVVDDGLLERLSNTNYRIGSELLLDVYDGDLRKLTYESYLEYLAKNEKISAEGISNSIKGADLSYFKTKQNAFLISLYYKEDKIIIIDNSLTAFIDSVVSVDSSESIPDLRYISGRLKF